MIYKMVDDYLHGIYTDDEVIVIRMHNQQPVANIEETHVTKPRKNSEIHKFKTIIRKSETGGKEPDIDKIKEIAGEWMFLD